MTPMDSMTMTEPVEAKQPERKARPKSQHPARIYAFKAKPPREQMRHVSDQMFAAHRYANQLIELERQRREASDAVVRDQYPGLAELEDRWRAAEERVKALDGEIKARNQAARSRVANAADRATLKEARAISRAAYQERKDARAAAFADPTVKETLARVNEAALTDAKAARSECGVYWGTYTFVENALRSIKGGPPPRFRRWDGEGTIAMQLQNGLSWEDALAGVDTRLRINVLPPSAQADPESRRSQIKAKAEVSLRVGSNPDRSPLWCKVLIHLHRRPPEGSTIKWVYLHRIKVGQTMQWEFQIVFERESWPRRVAPGGTSGVDINWRSLPEGLRVATAVGSDGAVLHLVLPKDWLSTWTKVEDLRSIRDKNFDKARVALAAWMDLSDPPEWFVEKAAYLKQWKSTERLSKLVWSWRNNRFAGDEDMYQAMEAWRKQNRHLQDWEAAAHRTAIRRRDEHYRRFAARLAYTYQSAVIEDTNWKLIKAVPGSEETDGNIGARTYQQIAAPGRLAQFIREAVEIVHKAPAKDTTRRCHLCGHINDFDSAAHIDQTCTGCGVTWDQDFNAGKNLLASLPRVVE